MHRAAKAAFETFLLVEGGAEQSDAERIGGLREAQAQLEGLIESLVLGSTRQADPPPPQGPPERRKIR